MTRVDEFDSFLRAGFTSVLQVGYALSGDRQVALDSTTDAFRRAWRDWSKIRDREPLAYVRNEAWKAITLDRGTHPLRRRREDDADGPLLEALGDLPSDERRLIVLMTLGNTDLEEASREVDVPAEEGIEKSTDALGRLEQLTGQPLDQIERRLLSLAEVTADLPVPDPAEVRQAARRGTQRNTVLLVVAALIGVIAAGLVVTDDDALARQEALPQREKLGSEGVDIVLDARKIDTDNLLSTQQVSSLEPSLKWKVDGTDEDPTSTTPYATCPTRRFADPDPLRVLVRSFSAGGEGNARVAQSIEVSRSTKASNAAAARLIQSFADCAHPRVQLLSTYKVERPFGDFTILKLRSNRSPVRIFTVGFASSGSITSTLVHEVDGNEGPSVEDFARTLNDSVAKICEASGGQCSDDVAVTKSDPPPTSEAPQFLGIVDLPPVADVDRVWASVEARSNPNPAATPCDETSFTAKAVQKAASRVYVLYQASELPRGFGVTETIGTFGSADAASKFAAGVTRKIDECPDRNPTATIDQESTIKTPDTTGSIWRVRVEVSEKQTITYRVGLIRRGDKLAQVTFSPSGKFDVADQKAFKAVVTRAGTRLQYE